MCSYDPFFRTNKGSSIWRQNDYAKLVGTFIFQGECRMKIEHVLFPPVFFGNLRIRLMEGHF